MIKRPILKIYNYFNEKKVELHAAHGIIETKTFGGVYDLSFVYPKFMVDRNKQMVLDDDGMPQFNDNTKFIQNEVLVSFDNVWYIIKQITEVKSSDGQININVVCKQKYHELAFKQVYRLILNPPEHNSVLATEAIAEILSYPYEKMNGAVLSSTTNTITIDTDSVIDYTGDKIIIIDGTGLLQERRIISYSTSTKIATLHANWTTNPDTTSWYRIHNSQYKLGTVDSTLLNDGVDDIYRGFSFQEVTILEALISLTDKFGGYLTSTVVWNETYQEFENAINLVVATGYNNVEFRYKKNMTGVSREVDSTTGCFTRLSPVGRNNLRINEVATITRSDDSTTGAVVYNEHEYGQSDLYNFQHFIAQDYTEAQCKKLFVRDYKFVNDGYSDETDLYNGAKQSLEELSLPKITYTLDSLDLSVLSTYTYLSYDVGQTVRTVDDELSYNFMAAVFKKTTNYDNPQRPSIELGNFSDNMGDYLTRLIKYNEYFTQDKKQYGKGNTVIIADELTSRNWRYADYVIPVDGRYTADEIIQKAIDDISTNTDGGTIQLLEGKYYLYDIIQLKDNVIITGNGNTTEIYPAINDIEYTFSADDYSNMEIKYLSIKYQSDGVGGVLYKFENAVTADDSDNFSLNNCMIGYVDESIFSSSRGNLITFYENVIDDDDFGTTSNNNLVEFRSCTNSDIFNSSFSFICDVFINIITYSSSDLIASEINIYNNNLSGVCDTFIRLYALSRTITNVKVYNNKIYGTSDEGIYSVLQEYSEIHNNYIDGIIRRGIYILNCDSVKVKNNNINICPLSSLVDSSGILSSNSSECDIQSNNIKNVGVLSSPDATHDLDYGIYIENGSNNIVASNDVSSSGSVSTFLDTGLNTITLGGNRTV